MAAKSTPSLKKRSLAAARASTSKTIATAKVPVEIVAVTAAVVPTPAPVVVAKPTPVVAAVAPAIAEVAPVAGPSAACLSAIANLTSFNADVARDAATTLGDLGEAAAVEPLIDVVANADGYYHGVVRTAAAISLGQLGDARAIDALTGLVDSWMAEASVEAVRALAKLGDARAAASIRSVMNDTTGYYAPIVRHAAEIALPRVMAARSN